MSRRRKDALVGLVRKISTQSPATVISTSPLRKPPRVHAPCIGRVTGAGRSPGSRVVALAPPSREYPSGILEEGSPLTVAGAAPGSIGREHAANLTGFPFGRLQPGDG